jgi:hypothetical protein
MASEMGLMPYSRKNNTNSLNENGLIIRRALIEKSAQMGIEGRGLGENKGGKMNECAQMECEKVMKRGMEWRETVDSCLQAQNPHNLLFRQQTSAKLEGG